MSSAIASLITIPLAIAGTALGSPATTTPRRSALPFQVATTPTPAPTTPKPTTPASTTPPPTKQTTARPKACVSDARVASARRYAASRPGDVSFSVFVGGSLRSYRGTVQYRSASLVKAMLLTADLRRHARVHAPLTPADRSRLGAMIHVSDNDAATATFNLVGGDAVRAVAHLAGMQHYSVGFGWGTSELTASDQARLWGRLNQLLPAQYRAYARGLLRTISHAQVWGGAPVARSHGFATMFKSGWLPRDTGWVVHQGMRLERGRCTVGIAVLTGHQSSMAAGIATIRGVTQHLLQ